MHHINLSKSHPELYQKLLELDQACHQAITDAGIHAGFTHLLCLRISQINQCSYCIRLHTQQALTSGETSQRIEVLSSWSESDYFTLPEQSALKLVEYISLIAVQQPIDQLYKDATEHLTETQVAAIQWLAIMINSWNRIAISSNFPMKTAYYY